jgi:uncharacterized protein
MDSENPASASEHAPESANTETGRTQLELTPPNLFQTIIFGPQGLRAGWSIALFFAFFAVFSIGFAYGGEYLVRTVLHRSLDIKGEMTPFVGIIDEGLGFLALLCAAAIVARIERRRILDYNLTGPSPFSRFFSGALAGFLALSALVGALHLGGWIQFGPPALTGIQIARMAITWAIVFLVVGLLEEGLCRCYLQFTLTRGVNFWWALGIVAVICAFLAPQYKNPGAWGIWSFAVLAIFHCLWLHLRQVHDRNFWYAAWAISTFFAFGHVSNKGETWIGIFAAAAVGFAFAATIRITGSAWWAIGCHAAWDWAESFFYGTPDSGLLAKGHFLTTTPSGPALWSGGTDGPEGSLLAVPAIVLILAIAYVQFVRRKTATNPSVLSS